MSRVAHLIEARLAAIERGDKALGREIYHQLQTVYGLAPHEIDSSAEVEAAGSVETEPLEVEAAGSVETAAAAPLPERAVRRRGKE